VLLLRLSDHIQCIYPLNFRLISIHSDINYQILELDPKIRVNIFAIFDQCRNYGILFEGIAYVQHGVSSSDAMIIPIACPCILSSGPPELPPEIAASVTIALGILKSTPSS
jgi:hypothetical protein